MRDALEKAVKCLQNGNSDSFDYIYNSTYKLVFFVAYRVLQNKHSAEDVVQQTYIKAMQSLNRYENNNFTAWLTTIAKNLAVNSYNKNKRETSTDFIANQNYFGECAMPDEDSFGLFGLAATILGEDDYKILIMVAVSGYKLKEVAKILQIPLSTVGWRYKKSIKILKANIDKGGNANV